MLAAFSSWIFMFFVFISYGDIFLAVYNKLCKRDEEYSLINLFLLGIPSLLIVLSLIHFIVPINSYVLLFLCLSSSVYWLLRRSRLFTFLGRIKNGFQQFSAMEIVVVVLFSLTILFITAWGVLNYDSGCYHYQSLRWIEEYSTVVGLGNIEERLGFNSNYFLLSAPFSMRFFLAEPLFALQGLLVVLIFVWIASEVIKSKYSFKCVFLLLLHILIIAINIMHFADSSTDVLPNQIVFYLIAYLVLYSDKLKNNYLLFILLPVTILTFKLSLAVFALLALLVLIDIVQKKEYKALVFIITCCFVICVLWLIRNVILSGYLVFPMHEIDLFSFDWKVPQEVAILERTFIHVGAIWQFKNLYNNALTLFSSPEWRFFHTYFIAITYVILALSLPYVAYLKMKKKIKNEIFILYSIIIISTVASYASAPDFRFTYGLVFGAMFIAIALFGDNFLDRISINQRMKYLLSAVFVFLLLIHLNSTFWKLSSPHDKSLAMVKEVMLKPRTYNKKQFADSEITHRKVQINNGINLYISDHSSGFTMYQLPAVPDDANNRLGWRFQHYQDLEARGTSLQDGFRTKNDK